MKKYEGLTIKLINGFCAYYKYDRNQKDSIIKKFKDDIIIFDPYEITVISDKKNIHKNGLVQESQDWALFKILGDMPFGSVQGLIAWISNSLIKKSIGICVISTFSTDYFMVKKKYLKDATEIFTKLKILDIR